MQCPDKTSEVRIGLVLYGGVSLCVYINGVAQEFFRAVLGHKPYKLLKALLGSDIAVDVISGTSAGGVNGIYLAYCLCQKSPKNFLQFSRLWRNEGDIGKLIHKPGGKKTNSLLDGEGYYRKQLEAAFSQLESIEKSTDLDPTEFGELDLFITGTDYDGNVYTRFDDAGRRITVKDHGTVFRLKYRENRYNDFDPANEACHEQLSKLARITSCFPVAFPPVEVKTKSDSLIAKWGKLAPIRHEGANDEAPRYYLDGGILDNKPFSYTVNDIYHRAQPDARRVSRKLFYVEPVPEVFRKKGESSTPKTGETGMAAPSIVEAGIAALISIPGYESIREDLQRILERNRQIIRFTKLEEDIRNRRQQKPEAPAPVQDGQTVERAFKKAQDIYFRSRLSILLDRVLQSILRFDQGREFGSDGKDYDERARDEGMASGLYRKLFNIFLHEFGSDQEKILRLYDPDYWMRRFFHVIYTLFRYLESQEKTLNLPEASASKAIHDCYQWTKCFEVIRFAMQNMVDRGDFNWRERSPEYVWIEIGWALKYLLDASPEVTCFLDGPPGSGEITKLLGVLNKRVKEWEDMAATDLSTLLPELSRKPDTDLLLPWLEQKFGEGSFLGDDHAREAWHEFDAIDVYRFPMQAASGIFEQDEISTMRISPLDAQLGFSRHDAAEKLCGDQLANFGGFFKKSWRSNDILWGRLDGMSKIFEALLTEEAIAEAPHSSEWIQYRKAVINSFDWNGNADLQKWLLDLSENKLAARSQLSSAAKGGRLDQLVGFLQEEIAREGLAMVAEDSITEQIDWNRAEVQTSSKLKFHVEQRRFAKPESGLISIAAQKLAKEAIEKGSLPNLREFFDNAYKVGKEELAKDVPKPVLAELASRAGLVLRDCLVPKIEQAGVKITAKKPYKYGFEYPLILTNGFARLIRFAPSSARVATFVLFFLSLAALAGGVFMWNTFIYHDNGFHLKAFLLLIVLPVAYLWVLPKLLDCQQLDGSRWRQAQVWLLITGLLAAIAFLGWKFSSLQLDAAKWLERNTAPVTSVFLAIAIFIGALIIAKLAGFLLRKLGKSN